MLFKVEETSLLIKENIDADPLVCSMEDFSPTKPTASGCVTPKWLRPCIIKHKLQPGRQTRAYEKTIQQIVS